MGLALDIALKFYTSVATGLKLKVKVFRANSSVCRRYRKKTGRGAFVGSPILSKVKKQHTTGVFALFMTT